MSRHRPIRALLADVPAGHAALLERTLAEAGWRVRTEAVHGAGELAAALRRRGWQAVLHGGDGPGAVPARKALALVRLADPHLPFIAVSPYVRPGDLAAVVRSLPGAVPTVSDPAALPGVLARELERARMRRRVGGAHRLLLAQQAITDHIAAGLEPAALLERVLATLGESLGWSFGAAWRADEQAGVLRCASVWHAPGEDGLAALIEQTRAVTLAPGQGLPGRVWAFRRPSWIADVEHNGNMPRAAAALRAGLVSAVSFPIALADECAGVIEFRSADIREPNAEVAAMFATVGGQLAQYLARRPAPARRSLEHAGALVVGLDGDGRVELANAAACALLGVREEDLLGRDWFAVTGDSRAAFARLLAGEHGDVLAAEQRLAGRRVAWRWAVSRDAGGRPLGALGWGEPEPAPSTPPSTASVVAGLAAALAPRR